MADISKITLPNGASYDFKDSVARNGLAGKAEASHTHNYLPLAGGEMNGPVKWNTDSLPEQTNEAQYLVCIDAFREGGTMKWKRSDKITVGNATKANGHTVNSDVPANAKFTDTVYTLPTATSSTLGGVKTGSNITNSSGTISLTKANVTAALGYTPPTTNTTYGVATTSALGLVKSGTDITVDSSGNVSVNDDSHNHVISNVDGLQAALDGKAASSHTHSEYASKAKYGDTTIDVGRKDGSDIGDRSTAEGYDTIASGSYSHAEGYGTMAYGACSHAEGSANKAIGERSHAEGLFTTAYGDYSHIEGMSIYPIMSSIPNYIDDLKNMSNDEIISKWNTVNFSLAKGLYSHVEGYNSLALGTGSHAEGDSTIAEGIYSHSGGMNSLAEGAESFSHGYFTKSSNSCEASFGKYNESNKNTLFSVGDGTADDARHNAFEITTTGGKLHDKDIAVKDDIPTISELIYTIRFSEITWTASGYGKYYYTINIPATTQLISVNLGYWEGMYPDEFVQVAMNDQTNIQLMSNTAKETGLLAIRISYI